MATIPVRKFAISVDPEEVVDFEEELSYFEEVFSEIGFEQVGTYKFRYADRECTITGELRSSRDGYELWMLVQAPDEHDGHQGGGGLLAGADPPAGRHQRLPEEAQVVGQTEDGGVTLPQGLHPWLGGKTRINPDGTLA